MIEKDQTLCPKCGRMYCDGFWCEGVCTADMDFCGEPTADFDEVGRCLRVWYEAHRETWWDRNRPQLFSFRDNSGVVADEFMLGMLNEVRRIEQEMERRK